MGVPGNPSVSGAVKVPSDQEKFLMVLFPLLLCHLLPGFSVFSQEGLHERVFLLFLLANAPAR